MRVCALRMAWSVCDCNAWFFVPSGGRFHPPNTTAMSVILKTLLSRGNSALNICGSYFVCAHLFLPGVWSMARREADQECRPANACSCVAWAVQAALVVVNVRSHCQSPIWRHCRIPSHPSCRCRS